MLNCESIMIWNCPKCNKCAAPQLEWMLNLCCAARILLSTHKMLSCKSMKLWKYQNVINTQHHDENECWIDGSQWEYYYPLTGSLGHPNVQHSWSRTDLIYQISYFQSILCPYLCILFHVYMTPALSDFRVSQSWLEQLTITELAA